MDAALIRSFRKKSEIGKHVFGDLDVYNILLKRSRSFAEILVELKCAFVRTNLTKKGNVRISYSIF